MGNAALQRTCREPVTAAGTGGKRSNKNVADAEATAGPRRVAVASRKQRYDEEREEEVMARVERRRRASVSRPGEGDGVLTATAVVTVKIVMRRKDADALVARLNARSARERKARMAELKRELRAGAGCGGASPEACRDAWKPRLAPIQESMCR